MFYRPRLGRTTLKQSCQIVFLISGSKICQSWRRGSRTSAEEVAGGTSPTLSWVAGLGLVLGLAFGLAGAFPSSYSEPICRRHLAAALPVDD